jgi:hypothetical protein
MPLLRIAAQLLADGFGDLAGLLRVEAFLVLLR